MKKKNKNKKNNTMDYILKSINTIENQQHELHANMASFASSLDRLQITINRNKKETIDTAKIFNQMRYLYELVLNIHRSTVPRMRVREENEKMEKLLEGLSIDVRAGILDYINEWEEKHTRK